MRSRKLRPFAWVSSASKSLVSCSILPSSSIALCQNPGIANSCEQVPDRQSNGPPSYARAAHPGHKPRRGDPRSKRGGRDSGKRGLLYAWCRTRARLAIRVIADFASGMTSGC